MSDRSCQGEDVKPDVETVALKESLLIPVRDNVCFTKLLVRVSPVDAKGSAIYKSVLSEVETMKQDAYIDSVLGRVANHPQSLHHFYQEDWGEDIRG